MSKSFAMFSGSLEGFVFNGDMIDSSGSWYVPEWAVLALDKKQLYFKDAGELYCVLPDGKSIHVQVGDWVVKNHKGTIFPIPKYIADNMHIPDVVEV